MTTHQYAHFSYLSSGPSLDEDKLYPIRIIYPTGAAQFSDVNLFIKSTSGTYL
jgi:hypothetical protein